MTKLKLFMDTLSRLDDSVPTFSSKQELEDFRAKYVEICEEEGVVNLVSHAGAQDGVATYLNLAKDIKAVQRANRRAGLPNFTTREVEQSAKDELFASCL
ncbi:hypothetical protein CS022_10960 [Veronia nyctiphanis]|uniref:Uncharacterized protein n=1 Tax=Veronia nyctiphanis TaxID=1278244 RepID=A0A4V1LSX8_9GAMM|nr:DUF4242 domain-containing protein [Veronia nyctiphanis]RXJ73248.1 hypothetical protein CS022_10960 [Veronia nyctiphanis]